MIAPRFVPFVLKQVIRHPLRTILTVGGVATAMFLFVAVQAMQRGVHAATVEEAEDTTLVVYREDRFCPFTSRLPQYYMDQIERIDGVRTVTPMKVVVNNCRTSLDVVTFRGVHVASFIEQHASQLRVIDGSTAQWEHRSDAALLGETLARRRGLNVGDRFDAAGVTSYVAGIVQSTEPQVENAAYVHLDFLQQATDRTLGIVTQFNVKVNEPSQLDAVAAAIDDLFHTAEAPTTTRSEKAFVSHVATDMIELIESTRWLGYGCLAAVLALVGNAIVLSAQDRIKEHAILQTLGYKGGLIGRLIISEAIVVTLMGGTVGSTVAMTIIHWTRLSMSADGLSIPIEANPFLFLVGLLIAAALGIVAGLVPAWQAMRRPIAHCFRAL